MNSVSSTSKIAIIGGTGLTHLADFKITQQKVLKTPYGAPSAPFVIGEFAQQELIFLARHGNPHVLPPHKINYQANIWGLKQLGVTDIIAVAAVGALLLKWHLHTWLFLINSLITHMIGGIVFLKVKTIP